MSNATFDGWEGEYLQHYDVLGMKWNMRRYQNKDGSLTPLGQRHYAETGEHGFHYKSHATKKYTKKANKQEAKSQKLREQASDLSGKKAEKKLAKAAKAEAQSSKFANRAKRSSEIDRGEQEYAKGLSTGKAIALTFFGGGQALKGYAQYRAMAGQSGKEMTGRKIVSGILGYKLGASSSRRRKAAYIRQDEGKKGLGQKVYSINKKITNVAGDVIDTGLNAIRNKKKMDRLVNERR